MRFELTVALKYLIPRWRQLSVSIISLISVLVISLVVWLVVLFLSVTEGIETRWTEELISLNAPMRVTPTPAYYNSYYYLIDGLSDSSNYSFKSIGEKRLASQSDPYDPLYDRELPRDFPLPDKDLDGQVKDPVKEVFSSIENLPTKGATPREFEVSFGNLRLQLLRPAPFSDHFQQSILTQVSYVASLDPENERVRNMILPTRLEDYNNLLSSLDHHEGSWETLFNQLHIEQLKTKPTGLELKETLRPSNGTLQGIGVLRFHQIERVLIPRGEDDLFALQERLNAAGFLTTPLQISFKNGLFEVAHPAFEPSEHFQLFLDENIPLKGKLIKNSLKEAKHLSEVEVEIGAEIQNVPLKGKASLDQFDLDRISINHEATSPSIWLDSSKKAPLELPQQPSLGNGILLAKHFQKNGVRLGDQGQIAYYAQAGSSMQEQQIPIYVAGFYDPGMMPMGNKLLFVSPSVSAILRENPSVSDQMLGNGINVWLPDFRDAEKAKQQLVQDLESKGLSKYWKVESYQDYELTKPILEQLKSDKNLFTLIAFIILLVACSNIISMLILLVNDKKKEIGIMQSMGASPRRIALIFGLCGFLTGAVSCLIGAIAATLTLHHLQALIDILSFFQGREAFQTAFYGSHLPSDLSYSALSFAVIATLAISLIAGLVPAIKAAKVRPTEILKSE